MGGRAVVLSLLLFAPLLCGQRAGELASGKFLVASRELRDPNFAESVILLIDYGGKGAMGIIINRRSRLQLNRLSDDLKGTADREDPLYFGGPVSRSGVVGLVRQPAPPREGAKPVISGVQMLSLKDHIEDVLHTGEGPEKFRIYLGYSGWAPGQLEYEYKQKAWHVFPADAGMIFDAHPETLWSRLIRKTELRFAAIPWLRGGYNQSLTAVLFH